MLVFTKQITASLECRRLHAPVQPFAGYKILENREKQTAAVSGPESKTLSFVISKITFKPVRSYHLAWEKIASMFPTVENWKNDDIGQGDTRVVLFKLKLKQFEEEFQRERRITEARIDSSSMVIPPGFLDRDLADLRLQTSIAKLVELRQRSWAPSHFNMDRFNAVFADLPEPDRSRLVEIATVGASIPLPEGFVRLSSPPPLRPLAQSLGNCFLKHAVKL